MVFLETPICFASLPAPPPQVWVCLGGRTIARPPQFVCLGNGQLVGGRGSQGSGAFRSPTPRASCYGRATPEHLRLFRSWPPIALASACGRGCRALALPGGQQHNPTEHPMGPPSLVEFRPWYACVLTTQHWAPNGAPLGTPAFEPTIFFPKALAQTQF